MNNSEKILIKNLFNRLKNVEKTVPERDYEAEEMIISLLNRYKNAPYYMVQTILVQENAIQELNNKMKLLERKNIKNHAHNVGFLSPLLNKKILNAHIDKNEKTLNQNFSDYSESNKQDLPNNNIDQNRQGRISSFLGNALQTAVGVAGGVVAGNILTNVFHNISDNGMFNMTNNKSNISEELEYIDDNEIENNSILDESILNYDNNNEYIDYEDSDLDIDYD